MMLKQNNSQKMFKTIFKVPRLDAKLISMSGLLLALDVILVNIAIGPAYFKISLGFISIALMAYLYGPIWAGILKVLSNIITFLLFGSGAFQIAFLFTAFLAGFISGVFLYQKKIKFSNVIISQLLIMIPISLIINSWFISILFGTNFQVLLWGRLFRNIILIPIQAIGTFYIIKLLEQRKITKFLVNKKK